MPTALAFVDDPDRLDEVPAGHTVVAIDPFTAIAAEQRGIDTLPLDRELDDLELEEIGAESFQRVEAICAGVDEAVRRADPRWAGASAHWRFQELKAAYDTMLIHALCGTRLARAVAATEAALLVRGDGRAVSVMSPALAAIGVEVTVAPAAAAPSDPAGPAPSRGRLAALRLRARRALRPRRPRVLCLDERYSVPAIAAALRARGAETLLWLPPPRRVRRAPEADLAGLAPLCRLAGVDIWPGMEETLRTLVERKLPVDDAALRSARVAVRRDRPDMLLASTFAAPTAKAAAAAAAEAGVSAVAARHGELAIRALPVMVYNDLDVADLMLCWGEWEARFVERYAPRPVRTAVVGAPMIEQDAAAAQKRADARRKLGFAEDERLVLLAPTALSGDEWFIGRRQPLDVRYFRHLVALVQELLAVEGVRIVIKEHAVGPGPLEVWARGRKDLPLTFLRGRFSEHLNLADAMVLDFASTTLVQALNGSARVYVVKHPITAWEPGVLEHLDRFGVRVLPAERLGDALRDDVEAGLLDAPVVHPRDAIAPLLATGPEPAAERAAAALMATGPGDAPTTIAER